jgi:hypothetical protein
VSPLVGIPAPTGLIFSASEISEQVEVYKKKQSEKQSN